jgi:hypothetical protein
MEMSMREMWTMVHGMGFGALYLLACSAALVELWRRYAPGDLTAVKENDERFLGRWLMAMAILAWVTVLSGSYIIYPWYRAVPPAGTVNLTEFPQRLLLSSSATSAWHSIGMEWKEHVAWIVPIALTMAAAVFSAYGRNLQAGTPRCHFVLCGSRVPGRLDCWILGSDAEQACAGHRRPGDSSCAAGASMTMRDKETQHARAMDMPNGPGAAAVLAAGIGCMALAVLAIAADESASIKAMMNFYAPTGPLSGVTTMAVVVWCLCWLGLQFFWKKRKVALGRICAIAVGLLLLSVLLTFPPIADLF